MCSFQKTSRASRGLPTPTLLALSAVVPLIAVGSYFSTWSFDMNSLSSWGLPTPTVLVLFVLVPLTAFGTVEAILHLKKYFGRTLRKLISIVDPVVPSAEDIAKVLSKPIPLDKLEEYIQEDKPVIDGAERSIEWANPKQKQKTPICVVFLHGWSACRQEGRPVVGRMAKHLQANLYSGRMPGHGRQGSPKTGSNGHSDPRTAPDGEALLREAKPRDLFLSALDSLRVGFSLGDRVVLVGISTGGALATWLASTILSSHDGASETAKNALEPLRDRLASLILISPAYALSHPLYPVLKHSFAAMRVLPCALSHAARTRLIRAAVGTHRIIPASNEDHYRYSTLQYPSAALLHLLDVLYEIEIVNHASITIPTLMIGNPHDPVVNFRVKATNAFLKFGDAPNKVLYCLSRGEHQHILSCDYLSPSTVDEVTQVSFLFLNTNGVAASRPRGWQENGAKTSPDKNHENGKRYIMELELERTASQESSDRDLSPTHRASKGLGDFSSYPRYGDVSRPLEF